MKKNIIDLLICQGFDGNNLENFSSKDSNPSTEEGHDDGTDDWDVGRCKGSVDNFFKRFHVVKLFGECGGYKKRGVPIAVILMYFFCRMFSPMSMYMEMKTGTFAHNFSKNVAYNFLNNVNTNWQLFLMRLSALVCGVIASLTTSGDGRYTFVIDDTPLERMGKDIELVSWVYNHVENRTVLGYHVLTLAWTDGVTTIPVRYSLVASSDDSKVVGPIKRGFRKGSIAARIRKMARTSKPELTVDFLKDAIAAGFKASAVVFDSWFATPPLIHRIVKEVGITAVGRMKDSSQKLWFNGKLMTINSIYQSCNKRRGVAEVKLTVEAGLVVKGDDGKEAERLPVRLVYVKNKSRKGKWVCLICSDAGMDSKEIVRLYGKRWGIEVLFKTCKQYLRFGKDSQGTSFEAQNAQIGLSYARCLFLALAQRESDDERSCGELFRLYCKEKEDLTFQDALLLVMTLFIVAMEECGIAECVVMCVLDKVVSSMPEHFQRVLCKANAIELDAA